MDVKVVDLSGTASVFNFLFEKSFFSGENSRDKLYQLILSYMSLWTMFEGSFIFFVLATLLCRDFLFPL